MEVLYMCTKELNKNILSHRFHGRDSLPVVANILINMHHKWITLQKFGQFILVKNYLKLMAYNCENSSQKAINLIHLWYLIHCLSHSVLQLSNVFVGVERNNSDDQNSIMHITNELYLINIQAFKEKYTTVFCS